MPMRLVLHLFASTLAVLTGAYVLKGVHIEGVPTAVVVAIVLGVLNVFLRPVLIFFTLPITFLTLGLFLFVINGALILLAAKLVNGFTVDNFWWAVAYSLVVSLVSSFLNAFL